MGLKNGWEVRTSRMHCNACSPLETVRNKTESISYICAWSYLLINSLNYNKKNKNHLLERERLILAIYPETSTFPLSFMRYCSVYADSFFAMTSIYLNLPFVDANRESTSVLALFLWFSWRGYDPMFVWVLNIFLLLISIRCIFLCKSISN